jgi:hypothetical protein
LLAHSDMGKKPRAPRKNGRGAAAPGNGRSRA